MTAPKARRAAAAEESLRAFALGFPETREEFPWGDRVVKVRGKVFVFLGRTDDAGFGLSVKLPSSGMVALGFPFASPTGYGLGKSGWVTARFARGEALPLPMLREWITESFRAVAPKKLVAAFDAAAATPARVTRRAPARRRRSA
jgi:predicted DNA-binding protein (MmcQ/YjbR family)